MAAIVVASMAVQLAVVFERLGGPAFREQLAELVFEADLLMTNRRLPAVNTAGVLLEGLLLFYAAARLAERSPSFTRRAMTAVAAGAFVAAAGNVWRVLQVATRYDLSLTGFVDLASRQRINVHYGDLNAAGSYFVLTLWTTIALVLGGGHRAWTAASAVIAAGLWITGSRTAMFAGLIACIVPLASAMAGVRVRRWAIGVGACAAVLIAAAGFTALMPSRGNQASLSTAFQIRVELARTAMNMVASRPLFGIGAGEFYQRTEEFSSPTLLAVFPRARHENAHNNFLQILAELGVVGFAAFIWILALAAHRTTGAIAAGDRLMSGVAAGMLAFLLSCLGGHPLLIPEVSATFWLVLGVLSCRRPSEATADTPAPRPAARLRLTRIVAAVAMILIATVPLRARRQIAESNLEHVGIGLSSWRRTPDNRQYRILSGRTAAVFVPGDAGGVTLPLRAAGRSSLEVELSLDGRLANVVNVRSDDWTTVVVVVPPRDAGRRFRRVDLSVRGDVPPKGDVLLVGKVEPR
jgi:O-antigen ligase